MSPSPATAKGHPFYSARTKERRDSDKEELTLALQSGLGVSAFARAKNLPLSYARRIAKELREEFTDAYQKDQKAAIGEFVLRHEKLIKNALQKAPKSATWTLAAANMSEGMIRTLQALGVLPKSSDQLEIKGKLEINPLRQMLEDALREVDSEEKSESAQEAKG